jgi:transposase
VSPAPTGTSRVSNPTYLDLATHYGTTILPARPRRPRDEAKVEVGVLAVERWILARLRNRRFFSLSRAGNCPPVVQNVWNVPDTVGDREAQGAQH